ncbi:MULTISPECIES: PTS system mannose/fructose/N-acetylgalactosamine-transporter subunit IIB [Enterococcus]|jgi:PTS system mannose-specific IIB component|uniref:PTS system mannose/fructose/N-acetylgalactosamine-transporter subunit IIB n=1 Tax=Enterococcus TaxID=1350 RepID=UPI0003544498|nr:MULTISPECIES: PTS sugar transporter subunit IIB [Enterococcus]EPH90098.1 PTS system sorbose subfamily IIB component [Enterococcus faecalis 06-MB-DW-09]AUJ85217.1 PTS mannose/fructose/sorbose transporter subunit IIB [Enterococcus sp. CR-Ec1]MBF0013975.1 PTS sugar transporter subunit IIB [Enterococcus casseliflavus]MCX4168945.1 PTS sugar transporter subunit IIB [Enterococcus casseliflavus]MDV7701459.1 PTS sugar transporter subunit IIB [Enterococcus casseliflavus]
MISMIRIDDRLVHGQVAVKWSKELGISRIVVVSDSIAQNEIQVSALKMAGPSGVKVAVLSLEKAIAILNDPRSEQLKILVVTNEPKYVAGLVPKLKEKPMLNMANYGRIGGSLSDKEKITETVYLSEEDKETLKEIFDAGYDFSYQPLPDDTPQSLKSLIGG